jgi:hypothetical protein
MSIPDYSAAGQLSPGTTLMLVYGVGLVLLAGIVQALVQWRHHTSRARAAAASVMTKEPEAKGFAVLRGTVETEEPDRPAIVVTLTEHGTESERKKKWSHVWAEIDRSVRQEPFYLVLESGTRVRVEPGDDVFLVDTLDLVERGNPRTRRASLENGETAYVSGVLEAGWHPRAETAQGGLYRGQVPSSGHVMRRGSERMLVSTEPLGERSQRLANAHRWMAIMLTFALALANGLVFSSTHVVHLFGEDQELDVVTTRTWETRSRNSVTTHYAVIAAYPTGPGASTTLESEVNASTYYLAHNGTLKTIPFRVVPSHPSYYDVGTGPTRNSALVFFTVGLLGALTFIYLALLDGARAWYDRKRVIEKGSGRLIV